MLDALSVSFIFQHWIIKEREKFVFLFLSKISECIFEIDRQMLRQFEAIIYEKVLIDYGLLFDNGSVGDCGLSKDLTAKLMKTFKLLEGWKKKERTAIREKKTWIKISSSGYQSSICSLLLIRMTFYCWNISHFLSHTLTISWKMATWNLCIFFFLCITMNVNVTIINSLEKYVNNGS